MNTEGRASDRVRSTETERLGPEGEERGARQGMRPEESAKETKRQASAQPVVADMRDRIAEAHDACLDDDHAGCRAILKECLRLLGATEASALPAAPNPWRQAVDRELVDAGLDCLAPDAEAVPSLTKLLSWRCTIALDPAVSEEAQALIERGRVYERCRREPAAQQPAVEPVALWQYREFHGENTVTPGWSDWKEVKPRNLHTDSVDDRVKELMSYIAAGHRYELRPLYASPTAQPGEKP